jgi:hypothetical protein
MTLKALTVLLKNLTRQHPSMTGESKLNSLGALITRTLTKNIQESILEVPETVEIIEEMIENLIIRSLVNKITINHTKSLIKVIEMRGIFTILTKSLNMTGLNHVDTTIGMTETSAMAGLSITRIMVTANTKVGRDHLTITIETTIKIITKTAGLTITTKCVLIQIQANILTPWATKVLTKTIECKGKLPGAKTLGDKTSEISDPLYFTRTEILILLLKNRST